jgi:hypothetical protein
MLTILVFEIKEGKNAQKVKKILTIIYHYLVVKKRNNSESILLNKDKG